jgi:hypothetical protein
MGSLNFRVKGLVVCLIQDQSGQLCALHCYTRLIGQADSLPVHFKLPNRHDGWRGSGPCGGNAAGASTCSACTIGTYTNYSGPRPAPLRCSQCRPGVVHTCVVPAYLPTYLPTYFHPSIHPSIHPSVHPSILLSIHPSIHSMTFIHSSFCLSIHLYLSIPISLRYSTWHKFLYVVAYHNLWLAHMKYQRKTR